MTDDVIEHLRNDGARLHAKALFCDPGDSLSVRIPGREEFLFMTPDRSDPTAFPFATTGLEAADLHATIYRSRKDAGGVLIGQTPWSSALARIEARIPTLFDEQARHLGPENIHVAYIVIDGVIDIPRTRARMPDKPDDFFLDPNDIADAVLRVSEQPRSAWTFEIDLRPYREKW